MAERTVTDDYEALRQDLNELRSDVATLADSLVQTGKRRVSAAKQSSLSEARERLQRLGSQAGDVRDRGREAVENVERRVASKPWQSVAAVFGIGMLIGAVLNWLLGRAGE